MVIYSKFNPKSHKQKDRADPHVHTCAIGMLIECFSKTLNNNASDTNYHKVASSLAKSSHCAISLPIV